MSDFPGDILFPHADPHMAAAGQITSRNQLGDGVADSVPRCLKTQTKLPVSGKKIPHLEITVEKLQHQGVADTFVTFDPAHGICSIGSVRKWYIR